MSGEPISGMPLVSVVDGVNDLMEISKYVAPNTYVSRKIAAQTAANLFANNYQTAIVYEMDGGGLALTTGIKGYITLPFNGTIVSVEILSTSATTATFDIWKTSYTAFDAGATHPVLADSITDANKPSMVSAVKFLDTTLTGWTTSFSRGDIFAFVITSNSSSQHVTVSLGVSRTVP